MIYSPARRLSGTDIRTSAIGAGVRLAAMTTRFGPKPMLDLMDYAPTTTEEMLDLEERLLDAGVSAERAARIPMRLHRLWLTGRDGLAGSERTNYRKELKKIGPPPRERSLAAGSPPVTVRIRVTHSYPQLRDARLRLANPSRPAEYPQSQAA